jgi:hypothetical protein
MPTGTEIGRSIYGAWRLLLLDPTGVQWFELSVEAFWRLFFAAALIAPVFVIVVMIDAGNVLAGASMGAIVLVKGIAYGLSWIAFPIAIIFLCRLLDLTETYIPYIIALNWSAIVQAAIFFPLALLSTSGALSAGIAAALTFVVTLGLLFYQWFIARNVLQAGPFGAIALVLLDLLPTVFIDRGADALLTSGAVQPSG